MKSNRKTITAFALVLVLVFGMFSPISASAASSIKYDNQMTVYLYATEEHGMASIESYHELVIKNATSEPTNVQILNDRNNCLRLMPTSYDSTKKRATITFCAMRKGKATISFQIGKKTYTSQIIVKSYTVPAQTVKISGVKNGKNIVSEMASVHSTVLDLDGKTKDAKLIVQKKGNWRLTQVTVTRYDNHMNGKTIVRKSFNGAAAKKTFNLGTLKEDYRYSFLLEFTNKNNGGVLYLEMDIS